MGRLFVLSSSIGMLGCPEQSLGMRVSTGMCPVGERCSADIPGLRFFGPPLAGTNDEAVRPFAAGGQESIYFRSSDGRAITTTTLARSDSPDIVVTQPGSTQLRLSAARMARGTLRVTDGSGLLLDSLNVEARALASLRFLGQARFEAGERYAFAPGRRTIHIALFDRTGARLVDTSLRFEAADREFTQTSWDTIELDMPNEDVAFAIYAGGTLYRAVASVGIADAIGLIEPDTEHVVGGGSFCFRLLADGAWIVGAEPRVTFDGVLAQAENGLSDLLPSRYCVQGTATPPTTDVTISAGPFTTTFIARTE